MPNLFFRLDLLQMRILDHSLATLIHSLPIAVVILNPEGEVVTVNMIAATMFGYDEKELIGCQLPIDPALRQQDLFSFPESIGNEEGINSETTPHRHITEQKIKLIKKNGAAFHIYLSAVPFYDDGDHLHSVIAVFREVETLTPQDTEERYRYLFEHNPQPMWVFDQTTLAFLAANNAAIHQYGYSREEFLAMTLKDIRPAEDIPTLLDHISHNNRDFGRSSVWRHRKKDGSIIDTEVIWHAIDFAGRQAKLVLANDITERNRAENELKRSEARFRCLVEQAADAIFIIDASRRIVDVNQCACDGLGYSREELLSMSITDIDIAFHTPENVELRNKLKREELVTLEGVHRRKDGSTFPVEIRVRLFQFDNQQLKLALVRDISERKRAESRIREQAELIDEVQDAIIVCGFDNTILFWNRGAEQLYGWKKAEATGEKASTLLYKNPAQLNTAYQAVLKQGRWEEECTQVTKERKEIVVHSRWTLMYDNSGTARSILCVNTDITEKKRLATQFLRAQRLESIGVLASGIAHDLNNVLSPILMAIQLLSKSVADSQSRQILDMLRVNAQRGADIVKQVLSFERGIEGERVVLQLQHIIADLEKILNQTVPKSIKIEVSIAKDLWLVSGNATQLYQLLMNLSVNASQAMPTGGRLAISADNILLSEEEARAYLEAKPGHYLLVKVEDTGTGIPVENLNKIFEPFFTTKEIGKGTGLGLSTVLTIAKSHGGFIDVSSQLGQGTTFNVYLPALVAQQTKETTPQQLNLPAGQGQLILVVDDEETIRDVTKSVMESVGYQVITAKDGLEALTLYSANQDRIKAVLLDMMMPNLDGLATIKELKKLNCTAPIIVSTGMVTKHKESEAVKAGGKAFLTKPYSAQRLLAILHDILE
ncbi:MAG: PAS domain S-box protein [Acidobacteriota bacterium]